MAIKIKNSSFKLIYKAVIFILLFLIADLVIGYFLVPFVIKKMYGINIREHVKLHTPHSYYNHGFNEKVHASKKFGNNSYEAFTNSLGMLDGRIRTIQKTGKKNIVFIGDSYIEGVGLEYKHTLCGYIEAKIDTKRINILNASVSSFSPKLYFLRIKYLIEEQHLIPNAIFCFPDYSDYGDEIIYEDFSPKSFSIKIPLIQFLKSHSIVFNFYQFVQRSNFLRILKISANESESFLYFVKTNNNFIKRHPDFLTIRRTWINPKVRESATFLYAKNLAEQNIDSLNVLCKKYDVKLYMVGYPRKSFNNIDNVFTNRIELLWKNFCQKRGIEYISLYELLLMKKSMPNQEPIYLENDDHWSKYGHYLIAQNLLKFIGLN